MNTKLLLKRVKEEIVYLTNKNSNYTISTDDVYVVWFSKTLQNAKFLLSTNVADGMYYEATYNGDTKEIYLDAYLKKSNTFIKIEGV